MQYNKLTNVSPAGSQPMLRSSTAPSVHGKAAAQKKNTNTQNQQYITTNMHTVITHREMKVKNEGEREVEREREIQEGRERENA